MHDEKLKGWYYWEHVMDDIRHEFRIDDDIGTEKTIYHYTTPEGLIGILDAEKCNLWFSQFDCLNDKEEGKAVYTLYHSILDKLLLRGQIAKSFYATVLKIDQFWPGSSQDTSIHIKATDNPITDQKRRPVTFQTFLCCFARSNDSLPMWRYYTKGTSYRGYNIGFSIDKLKTAIEPDEFYELKFSKVIYGEEYLSQLIERLILSVYNNVQVLGYGACQTIGACLFDWRLLFKHKSFEDESEVRGILKIPLTLSDEDKTHSRIPLEFRSSNGFVVPYIKLTINKTAVKQITVGPLLDFESAKNGIQPLLNSGGYDEVKLTASEIPIRY